MKMPEEKAIPTAEEIRNDGLEKVAGGMMVMQPPKGGKGKATSDPTRETPLQNSGNER